jgi:hypothetical protein
MDRVEHGWIGIDAGKGHHHVVLIDQEGRVCCRDTRSEPESSHAADPGEGWCPNAVASA